jgi:urease accessory protein
VPTERGAVASAGWRARLELSFEPSVGRTVLRRANHRGPLRVQRALYPEGDEVCHVYLVHPPGGVVAGDELAVDLHVAAGAHVVVTTPGAQRLYRSEGARARVVVSCRIDDGGVLEYLPQETIAFSGCRAELELEVELSAGGRFLGWEITVLGRAASAAPFAAGELVSRLGITRDARPEVIERARWSSGHGDADLGGRGRRAGSAPGGSRCTFPGRRHERHAARRRHRALPIPGRRRLRRPR